MRKSQKIPLCHSAVIEERGGVFSHVSAGVFYAQTYHPDLSVDVISIGKVTADLSIFDSLDGAQEITFSVK